ncbi:tetraspanin-15 [Octopus sinensis]|uniref:Tetraspanin n=1 Tax=Octopus sinensis TaxID=2607531 RepID=A0A7E6F4K7_9MOLL|nr:tetraspanin-15 [Octopus sinensis]
MAPNQDTAQQKMLEAEKHRNPHLMKHPCKPLCANTAYSCNKLWLFLYTLLYVFVGITLLIIGVWAEVERRKYGALNNLMSLPVALLLSVGLIIFINAILGLVGTFQEHVILLKVFLTITVVAFFVQVSIGILAFIYRNETELTLNSEELRPSLAEYHSNKRMQSTLDRLQSSWECCGFDSFHDYEVNAYFKCDASGEESCGVPPSCCISSPGDFPRYSCGYNVRRNLTVETNKIIHTDGCTSLLRRLLVLRLDIVGMAGLGSAIPQIIGFLLGYYFIRRVEEYRTWYCVGVIGSSSSANS